MVSKVSVKDNFINENKVNEVIEMIDNIPNDLFINRGEVKINYGVDGDKPNYISVSSELLPNDVVEAISKIAPKLGFLELEHFEVNKYKKGDSLPWHVDKNYGILGTQILQLHSNDNVFEYKDSDGNIVKVADKAGTMIEFNDLFVNHRVNTIESDKRYLICFFYK